MKYFENGKIPIKSWCENPEKEAIDQALNLANLSFAFRQICLMPDVHAGYGMPIGGVIALENTIIPNAVGVDISCGMLAVKTDLKIENLSIENLKNILSQIRETIPVGFNRHRTPQDMSKLENSQGRNGKIVAQEFDSACKQLGSLGGGNHFCELQKGNDGHIWFMLHSGSRNIGLKVANYYNQLAKELIKIGKYEASSSNDLAYFPFDSKEGQEYWNEMIFCMNFAAVSRELMARRIKEAMYNFTKCDFLQEINIHHNYASIENHFKKEVIVHRKGATSARKGEIGIIPGSQGTASYIVMGKGNPESFQSCSHGAGRRMGRKFAKKNLNLEEEKQKLDAQGILHSVRSIDDLDEAPSAYKDISVVIEEQSDLIDIMVELKPLAVVKG